MIKLLWQSKLWRTIGFGILGCLLLWGRVAQASVIQTLYASSNNLSGLASAPDGYLYGTTVYGGTSDLGTVFRVSTAGAYQVLHSFGGVADGANPQAPLKLGTDGYLYGTTPYGGANKAGGIFKVSTNGTLTLLHSFVSATEGAEPMAGLVYGTNGVLYGTASQGGTFGFGTLFQITTNGTFTTLHSFAGSDGATPVAALVSGTDGFLYGTTQYGGANNRGTVFRISTAGTFTTLLNFNGVNGGNPQAALVQGTDGAFYGTTAYGGAGEFGSVFKIIFGGPLGPGLTSLYSPTNESLGSNPSGGLALGADGKFYGSTGNGGTNGFGALFQVVNAGSFTPLYSFTGNTDGAAPVVALDLGLDGNLYGTTSLSGSAGGGTLFEILGPLVIAVQPVGQTNYIGTTAAFSVTAGGPGPYTYQWRKNGVNLSDGGTVSGSVSNLLTLRLVVQGDATNYSVIVSNTTTSVTSSNALLTVVVITPKFGSTIYSSNHLYATYSGTIGDPNGQYTVLMSTNLLAPRANWTPLLTNLFNGSGGFTFTNAVIRNETNRFYMLHLP